MDQVASSAAPATRRPTFGQRVAAARVFSYAIVEQATFSGASFVVLFVLARWLTPTEFGVFSSLYAGFLLFQNLFDAVMVEPLAIYGSREFAPSLPQYLARLLAALGVASVLMLVVLGAGAALLDASGAVHVDDGAVALAVATPLMLMRWLVRQPCYMLEHAEWSIVANLLFVALTVGSFALVERAHDLTAPSAVLCMGAAAVLSSGAIAALWLKPRWTATSCAIRLQRIAVAHWRYGRWAVADKVLAWLSSQLVFVLLPVFANFAAAGALRAFITLMTPANMIILAIYGMLLPRFARLQEAGKGRELWPRMRRVMVVMTGAMAAYGAAVVLFGPDLMQLVYLGKYNGYVTPPLMILLALGPVLNAVISTYELALRARLQVRLLFARKALPAIVSVVAGIPLMIWFSIVGALLASLIYWCLIIVSLATVRQRSDEAAG